MNIVKTVMLAEVPILRYHARCHNELCGPLVQGDDLVGVHEIALGHLYQTGHMSVDIEERA